MKNFIIIMSISMFVSFSAKAMFTSDSDSIIATTNGIVDMKKSELENVDLVVFCNSASQKTNEQLLTCSKLKY